MSEGIVVEMIQAAGDMSASMILTSQLQSSAMTGSRVSLSASTRERGTRWKVATTVVLS